MLGRATRVPENEHYYYLFKQRTRGNCASINRVIVFISIYTEPPFPIVFTFR